MCLKSQSEHKQIEQVQFEFGSDMYIRRAITL